MKKQNNYRQALKLLEDLHHSYPEFSIGRHLSTALADYGDYWGITDKEFCFALEKYIAELELDNINISSQEYVNKIIEDANNLFSDDIEEEEECL